MNKAKLKSYAPQARKDFIAAVTARANLLGLSDKAGTLEVAPASTQGDVTVIAGQAWPAKVDAQRSQLITRIKRDGFAQTLEAVAYTWFNRFAALRYMELHDYLGHGHRALSSAEGTLPEILTHAADLAQSGGLPGLKPALVTEMKLAGNRDGELYRMLLVAQCNALSAAMPFLFERIDDETELLLPDNLLRTDSVIAKLISSIDEDDWKEVEIIGWLYQFYISERKDQVIGKVVKSEDIPAATQLFTPNWIVQYLVQNSVGRLWLMANPQSTLAKEWPYYITPAEQTPEVQAQLDALIQTRVREDGNTLNPETITVLDPACGSGHILVVAYDVLKAIYLERGYQPRAIPRLILEKNLYGLDIDDRAAQMAGFALLMKARADDRRLFTATDEAGNLQPPKLNVLSLQESKGLSVDELATHLASFKVQRATVTALVETFEHAKTFGSLIQIPYALKTHLTVLPELLALVKQNGDMYASAAADDLLPLVQQARFLDMQFDAVVANPPYMGVKGMAAVLKEYCKKNFVDSKTDLFAAFMERSIAGAKPGGFASLVTMHAWMFLSTFEQLRTKMTRDFSIDSLMHIGSRGFDSIGGEVVQTVAFCLQNVVSSQRKGVFLKLTDGRSEAEKMDMFREIAVGNSGGRSYHVAATEFDALPGSPIAYWASDDFRRAFRSNGSLESEVLFRQGMSTTDAERFERLWHEVSSDLFVNDRNTPFVETDPAGYWYPFNKGGSRRKWYGNFENVVRYERNGQDLLDLVEGKYPNISDPEFVIKNRKSFFLSAITYASIGTGDFSARFVPDGFAYSVAGPAIFANGWDRRALLALLCSNTTSYFLRAINPTLGFQIADVGKIPCSEAIRKEAENSATSLSEHAIGIAKADWDEYESSWEFQRLSLADKGRGATLELSWTQWFGDQAKRRAGLKEIEEANNQLFILAYGLQHELAPEVPESQITLTRADREKDCQRLISYAIGCMMGRYSLDEPGLIYARAGNVGFEPGGYAAFPADADGIVPITDELWFTDDAPSRIREFLRAVWGPDTLEENMAWLAESLGAKASETPDETIRRYIADKFFKDHLQTYKKRPIYWLFSSGKQGAFHALVYLHRYHEGTLARLRAEYVVPLTGKIQSRIEMLQKDAVAASSTAARNKLAKEVEKLKKKHVELLAYDEQLRHYADMRITLDLDDGVKVNYGKFGDLLAEVKAVTGGMTED